MFNLIKKMLMDSLTTKDGQSFDLGRIIWAQGAMLFFGLTIYNVVFLHVPFDYIAFGSGFGVISAGSGAALMLKKSTEPNEEAAKDAS